VSDHETIVVGAGQAGLAAGYCLSRAGLRFTLLDAHAEVGASWARRWDSLRLFTPARYGREVLLSGRDTGSLPRRFLGRDIYDWLWPTLMRPSVDSSLGRACGFSTAWARRCWAGWGKTRRTWSGILPST
jgi:glycine/D-amino acid oxidase-like deaminating enzyme